MHKSCQVVRFVDSLEAPHAAEMSPEWIAIWPKLRGKEVVLGRMVPRDRIPLNNLATSLCSCTEFWEVSYDGFRWVACRAMLEMD